MLAAKGRVEKGWGGQGGHAIEQAWWGSLKESGGQVDQKMRVSESGKCSLMSSVKGNSVEPRLGFAAFRDS